jgi:hypothetical protein
MKIENDLQKLAQNLTNVFELRGLERAFCIRKTIFEDG